MSVLSRVGRSLVFIACLVLVASACGSRAVSPDPPVPTVSTPGDEPQPSPAPPQRERDGAEVRVEAPGPDCSIGPDDGAPIEAVGLVQPVSAANAPHATNQAERLVFRQLYETPLRLDCEGTLRAGLAEAWEFDGVSGGWTLAIRPGARYTDGTPVTSSSVLAAWTAEDGGLREEVRRHITSVAAVDEQHLSLVLRSPAPMPTALADPDLAVFRRVAEDAWPLGTTAWRAQPDAAAPSSRERSRLTMTHVSDTSGRGPVLIDPRVVAFTISSGADGRDLLDAGVDLLITDDPAVLGYAASLPQYESAPLPWDRTALFVSRVAGTVQPLPADARSALARAGVRSEARGAEGPFWWETTESCDVRPSPAPLGTSPERRIVYDRDDRVGRDLAERIVGLVGSRAGEAVLAALLPQRAQMLQRAAGLTGTTLGTARRRGSDAGYVVTVLRRPAATCARLAALLAQFPWADPAQIVALVDTRQRAVVRVGRAGLSTDASGTVIIDAAPVARRPAG